MAYIKPREHTPADDRERIIIKKTFDGDEYDVVYVKGTPGKDKEEMAAMRASGNVSILRLGRNTLRRQYPQCPRRQGIRSRRLHSRLPIHVASVPPPYDDAQWYRWC